MPDEEGAVNEEIPVSPTEDNQEEVEEVDPEVVDQDQEEGETVNEPEESETEPENVREGFIPRQRFDAVNERAQAAEARATELENQNREFQARQADLTRAHASGYPSVESYREANATAQAAGFENVEAQIEYWTYANQQAERLNAGTIDESVHNELLQARHLHYQNQSQLKRNEAMLGHMMLQTRDKEIADTTTELSTYGAKLDAEMMKVLEGSSPQVIAQFRRSVVGIAKSAADGGKSKVAAEKAAEVAKLPPTGRRNGSSPAPQSPTNDQSWRGKSMKQIMIEAMAKG